MRSRYSSAGYFGDVPALAVIDSSSRCGKGRPEAIGRTRLGVLAQVDGGLALAGNWISSQQTHRAPAGREAERELRSLQQNADTNVPGLGGNLVDPLQIQLLGFCTEAHPGWDNLSGERDAELRKNAPSTGEGSGAGGPWRARHIRTSAGTPAPCVSVKKRGARAARALVGRSHQCTLRRGVSQRLQKRCLAAAPVATARQLLAQERREIVHEPPTQLAFRRRQSAVRSA